METADGPATTSSGMVDALTREGRLALKPDAIAALGAPPKVAAVAFDRVEGMLLGLAIGDALGNTTEAQVPAERRAYRGEIRDYLPNRYVGDRRVGLPSDDSQLAFWTVESLLCHGRVVPEDLAAIFASGRIFGMGSTVREFRARYAAGEPWYDAAPRSAGNGALMRIAPVVLPHLGRPSSELWADTILASAVTHNDPSSLGACVALVGILWELLAMPTPPPPEWWLDAYCARARLVERDAVLVPRAPDLPYRGPVWGLVDSEVRHALRRRTAVCTACDRWYSGAFLLETVPSALYILALSGADPEEAIIRAVNDTRDNDTIAAIVGAAVGALHGRNALPPRWIEGLAGRTREDDDGRVFDLIDQVRQRWWKATV